MHSLEETGQFGRDILSPSLFLSPVCTQCTISIDFCPVVLHLLFVHHSLSDSEMWSNASNSLVLSVHHPESIQYSSTARNVSSHLRAPAGVTALLIFHCIEALRSTPVVVTLSLEVLGVMLSLEYWDISPFVYLTHSCEIKCFIFGWRGSILAVHASFCVWVLPTDCWSSALFVGSSALLLSLHFLLGLVTLVHMNLQGFKSRAIMNQVVRFVHPIHLFLFFSCKLFHYRLMTTLGLVSDF